MDANQVLNVEFDSSDIGNTTVRGYLEELLTAVLTEGESFSGKRPFGNSGWEYDLAKPLIAAGFMAGSLDDDGYIEEFDQKAWGVAVEKLMVAVFAPPAEATL